jgi:23S rRNA (adenine2030-N6)-methyltransferase
MNYRHHFHAGNFADVMKHVLLLQLLTRLNSKDKPYRYIDTHGGAGQYDLSSAPAQKSGEFLTGIQSSVMHQKAYSNT